MYAQEKATGSALILCKFVVNFIFLVVIKEKVLHFNN